MMSDSVSDALIRIKNGYRAYKPEVVLSYSKVVISILKLLEKEGYIGTFKEVQNQKSKSFKQIQISLKYGSEEQSLPNRKPALTEVKRVSKPGLRVYKGSKQLPRVLNGLGLAIISTPKGIMSNKQARKENLGGEVMAYVW